MTIYTEQNQEMGETIMKKSTLTIIGGVAAAIVIIAGGFGLYHWYQGKSES